MATPSTPVSGPPPLPLPPHHKAVYDQATIEEDDRGRFIRIPLENTDPFGFERKRRKDWRCKYCHNEKCHPGAQCAEKIKFKKNLDIWRRVKKNNAEMRKEVQELSE